MKLSRRSDDISVVRRSLWLGSFFYTWLLLPDRSRQSPANVHEFWPLLYRLGDPQRYVYAGHYFRAAIIELFRGRPRSDGQEALLAALR